MPKMTKILKRQLSADERIRRYFDSCAREYSHEMMKRFRLMRVEQEDVNGNIRILQIRRVVDTDTGMIVRVR